MTAFLDAPTRALPDWFGTDWTPPAPDVYVDYTRVSPWPRAPIPDWPQWVLRMYPAVKTATDELEQDIEQNAKPAGGAT